MQLVWQPYLSKTRLLCVRNSGGGSLSKHIWHSRGGYHVCPRSPCTWGSAVTASGIFWRGAGGGGVTREHLARSPWRDRTGGRGAGGVGQRTGALGSAQVPTSLPSAGRGSRSWGCCPPCSERRSRNTCFLGSENNVGSQMGHGPRPLPLPLCAKVCLSGEQQRVAGGGRGTSGAPGARSSPTAVCREM